ncbi:MAG TPA: hypothetical protein VGH27_32830 [Streptosporangiaceae bacterium]
MKRNLAIAATTSLMIAILIAVFAIAGASHAAPRHSAGDSPWDGPNNPGSTSQQA